MADALIAPVLAELDAMAKTVPLDEPWRAPRALEWDSMTCETFKRGHAPRPGASNLFDLGIEAIFACEPRPGERVLRTVLREESCQKGRGAQVG